MAQHKIIQLKEKSEQPVNDSSLFPITTTSAVVDYNGNTAEQRLVTLENTKIGWKNEEQEIHDIESNYYTKIEIDEIIINQDSSISLEFENIREHYDTSINDINHDMDVENNYININTIANHPEAYSDKATAVNDVPVAMRKFGLCVTYLDMTTGLWISSQFKGSNLNAGWQNEANWQDFAPIDKVDYNDHVDLRIGGKTILSILRTALA